MKRRGLWKVYRLWKDESYDLSCVYGGRQKGASPNLEGNPMGDDERSYRAALRKTFLSVRVITEEVEELDLKGHLRCPGGLKKSGGRVWVRKSINVRRRENRRCQN